LARDLAATQGYVPPEIRENAAARIDRAARGTILSTTNESETNMNDVALQGFEPTERALTRVAEILSGEAPGSVLRISVNGGGCSGFQYSFDIVPAAEDGDLIMGDAVARVAVDPLSLEFIKGARLDFVEDLMGSSFRFENPNATASCGCGASFAV
jgi:iron-sulfur cluster assembly accessory protein